ncbi:DUF6163 family protein [Bartonella sp. CB175]|uniref:DUF6163 family protein n=1 Tax=Bartonella sp. CB175 TaxID=3112256 RepID=UPI00300E55F3
MINSTQKHTSKINILLLIYSFYLRFLALICLSLSIFYWLRLVGVFPGVLWQFDLMPWQWKFLTGTLAIIYPIALIGLWMYSPWGIVLWCIAVFTETFVIKTLCFDSVSTYQSLMPLFHGTLFLIFMILQIMIIFFKKKSGTDTSGIGSDQ